MLGCKIYSSGITRKGGYKYYILDLSDLGPPELTGNHLVYPCPWCFEEKHDKKLYYNPKNNLGFCQRCQIVVFAKDGRRPTKVQLAHFSWVNYFKEDDEMYDISLFPSADTFDESREYLSNRKGHYKSDVINQYNIRAFETDNNTAIILPDTYPDKNCVDSFQVTYVMRYSGQLKYVTYSSDKFIYYLNDRVGDSKLILVEGIFDSIASGGCAMLGKTLSKNQLKQLYNFVKVSDKLKEVFVVLDGEVPKERKIKTGAQVLRINSGLKVYYTDLPDELDPEEAVEAGVFNKCLESSMRVFN